MNDNKEKKNDKANEHNTFTDFYYSNVVLQTQAKWKNNIPQAIPQYSIHSTCLKLPRKKYVYS